jgi:hypothetical protein
MTVKFYKFKLTRIMNHMKHNPYLPRSTNSEHIAVIPPNISGNQMTFPQNAPY